LACPFIATAAALYREDFRGIPCAPQPRGQTVVHLSPDVATFVDPPGESVPKETICLVTRLAWRERLRVTLSPVVGEAVRIIT